MRFGCLCISLQFNQPTNQLILYVLEASDLPADPSKKKEEKDGQRSKSRSRSGNKGSAEKEDEVKIDPMVKASIKLDGKKVKKEKTSTKTNTTNPYYNEKLTFEVRFTAGFTRLDTDTVFTPPYHPQLPLHTFL